jgi:hypothetical protein
MAALDKGSLSGDDLIELVALMLRNAAIGAARFTFMLLLYSVPVKSPHGVLLGSWERKSSSSKRRKKHRETVHKGGKYFNLKEVESFVHFKEMKSLLPVCLLAVPTR